MSKADAAVIGLSKRIDSGDAFRRALDDPATETFFASLRDGLIEDILKADANDDDRRLRGALAVRFLDRFHQFMKATATRGDIAQSEIAKLVKG
jgi:hypothetical protein